MSGRTITPINNKVVSNTVPKLVSIRSKKMQEETARKKAELQVKIKEQEVLQYELSSLRPKAKVYRQQRNSNILFLSGMEQEMHRAKQNLESLQKEYKELETSSEEDKELEGELDTRSIS